MIKTHDKEYFYKYVTVKTAFTILNSLKVKCSSPLLFNDPFDTLLELRYDFPIEEYPKLFWEKIHNIIFKREKFIFDHNCKEYPIINFMVNNYDIHQEELKFEKVKDSFSDLRENAKKLLRKDNEDWLDYLKNDRIFCMSEEYTNILMWAHYAEGHKGAVIEFKCVPEIDSAFCAATKVSYSNKKPTLGSFDELFDNLYGVNKHDYNKIYMKLTYTKSSVWSYEKEWRYALKKISDADLFDLRSFSAKELNALYFGCTTSKHDQNKITNLIKEKLPHMHIYQATANPVEYKLDFDRIY